MEWATTHDHLKSCWTFSAPLEWVFEIFKFKQNQLRAAEKNINFFFYKLTATLPVCVQHIFTSLTCWLGNVWLSIKAFVMSCGGWAREGEFVGWLGTFCGKNLWWIPSSSCARPVGRQWKPVERCQRKSSFSLWVFTEWEHGRQAVLGARRENW